MTPKGNRNADETDSYFFKKYYTWRGQPRIARSPMNASVIHDDALIRLKRHDESEHVYALTLIQAWEDGCRSDCVDICTCEHRDFPWPSLKEQLELQK